MSWTSPQNSRLYVDRIFGASSRFANWEPARQIELGDYGKIDKKTGEFRKRGNIFEHKLSRDYASENLTSKRGATDDVQKFLSLRVFDVKFDAGVDISEIPAVASFAVKEKFKFSRGRAAVLVMHKPTPVTLDGDRKGLPSMHLRGMHLVTEVIECRDYFMFLSSEKSGVITLALEASSPLITPAGGEMGGGWFHNGADGVYKKGSSQTFTPLFSSIRYKKWGKGYRDEAPSASDEENWAPSLPPWGILDDEGEDESEDEDDDESSDEDQDTLNVSSSDAGEVPVPAA